MKILSFNKIIIKPWMLEEETSIIEEILLNLQPDNSLEWGVGYGTIYFQKFIQQDAKWISVEHTREWAQKVSYLLVAVPIFERHEQHKWSEFYMPKQLTGMGIKTINRLVRILKAKDKKPCVEIFYVPPNHFPFTDEHEDGTYSDMKDYIEFPDKFKYFDFILVDGRARKDCLIKAHAIVKDKGVVILHDANRKHYQEPLGLYKHQMLFTDNPEDARAGGLWIGSKGLKISAILDLDKHKKVWNK